MSRYYLYLDSAGWMELEVYSGKLRGRRGELHFLYQSGGALYRLQTETVLRELRAHQAGTDSHIQSGPALPWRRCAVKKHRYSSYRPAPPSPPPPAAAAAPPSLSRPPHTPSPPRPTRPPSPQTKELYIEYSDVDCLQRHLSGARHPSEALAGADAGRFERDPRYRYRVLYQINPLVKIQRLPSLDRRLLGARAPPAAAPPTAAPRTAAPPTADMSQEQFAANLGLTHVEPPTSRRISKAGLPYSTLEDRAVVRWLLEEGEERAGLVKGNRLWRELEPHYPSLSGGVSRSWHSLRNRYLRYILPALPALHVSPQDQRQLRAAAARGELKRRSQRPPSPPSTRRSPRVPPPASPARPRRRLLYNPV